MDIPRTIDSIIQQRKQRLPEIDAAIQRLKKAHAAVELFKDFKSQLSVDEAELSDQFYSCLAGVSTDEFDREYRRSLTELERLKARFSRDQVSISFVGRAGQGKSLVLQRISGLDSDVIPSSGGTKDCTGARSVIVNRPGQEPSADITFFTEQEFLDIINTYLSVLFSDEVPQVRSLGAVRSIRIADLEKRISNDPVKVEQMKHLRAYIDHAQELRELLGTSITVPKEEIEQYVAQYSHEDTSVNYYYYLAVKDARIFAPFPTADCGKIILVDTIGTGATSLGVDEEMIRTVREDSDAIILMFRPEPMRGRPGIEHFELLDKIIKAVSPEYTGRMLFWLINRVETGGGRNADVVDEIISTLQGDSRAVAGYLNVNCFSEGEVRDNLLSPVLNQLSTHLADIDRMLLNRTNDMLSGVSRAYSIISRSFGKAETALVNVNEQRKMRPAIQRTIDLMTNCLRDLFYRYESQKDKDCEPLKAAAEIKLKNVLRSLPGIDRILQELNKGRMDQHSVFRNLGSELRLDIINDFLELNRTLDELVRRMKCEAIHCLADSDKGRMGFVVDADPDDPTGWLNAALEYLDDSQVPMIQNALRSLRDFDLRMENFLIYKVRCCLTPIEWLDLDQTPQIHGDKMDKQVLAENIRFQIDHALNIIYNSVKKELGNFYSFPNTAMYAVLRDFYDRVTFMAEPSGNTVSDEWADMYEDAIPQIWQEEHQAFSAMKERSEEWSALCKAVGECAASGFFRIN